MTKYWDGREELARESALASARLEAKSQIAGLLGATSFAEELADPHEALGRVLCLSEALPNNEDFGEAAREVIASLVWNHAKYMVDRYGPSDGDYEFADSGSTFVDLKSAVNSRQHEEVAA